MSLVAVGLLLTLGAQPAEVDAVLLTRKSGLTVPQAADLQSRVTRALEANGLTVKVSGPALLTALKKLGVKDPSACNGRRSCIQELASQLQAPTLVSVSATRVDGETAVALELVRAGEAQSTVKDSFVVPPGSTSFDGLTQAFATRVQALLAPRPVEPPPPTPPLVTTPKPNLLPEPAPPPPPLVVETPAPAAKSRTTPVVLTTLGGVSLAAGVGLLIASAVLRGPLQPTTLSDGRRVINVPEEEALRRNTDANILTGTGIGAAAVGAGLLTGAIVTW